MSRLKRSRALRRNLRKQARKGTLSARERKTLLQQEKRFRKARRPFMRGLGFGAGLGTGALLVPGVGGLISGLGGLRPEKEDPNEDPKDDGRRPDIVGGAETMGPPSEGDARLDPYADPEGMGATRATSGRGGRGEVDEFEDPEGMGATRATSGLGTPMTELDEIIDPEPPSQPQTRIEDIVLPEMEEIEEDEEEVEDDIPELTRGERAVLRQRRRDQRNQDARAQAAIELGLGGSESELPGTLSGRNMLDYLDDYGRTRLPGARVNPRPARPLPVDRPDPRMGTALDPRLPVALGLEPMSEMDRVEMLRRRMAEGGRVDKSNDLVARIKRKYGLR